MTTPCAAGLGTDSGAAFAGCEPSGAGAKPDWVHASIQIAACGSELTLRSSWRGEPSRLIETVQPFVAEVRVSLAS